MQEAEVALIILHPLAQFLEAEEVVQNMLELPQQEELTLAVEEEVELETLVVNQQLVAQE